jgi:hypothetical protein
MGPGPGYVRGCFWCKTCSGWASSRGWHLWHSEPQLPAPCRPGLLTDPVGQAVAARYSCLCFVRKARPGCPSRGWTLSDEPPLPIGDPQLSRTSRSLRMTWSLWSSAPRSSPPRTSCKACSGCSRQPPLPVPTSYPSSSHSWCSVRVLCVLRSNRNHFICAMLLVTRGVRDASLCVGLVGMTWPALTNYFVVARASITTPAPCPACPVR